jgi:hypothetical protein
VEDESTGRISMSAVEASRGAGAAATKAAKRVVKMVEARILMFGVGLSGFWKKRRIGKVVVIL